MTFCSPGFGNPARYPTNISTLFQHCLLVDATSRRGATLNQRWSNAVYFNVRIYKVEQRWINVVYCKVDMSKVGERRNNVIFNFGKRRNNVVKMTISKRNKKNSNKMHGIQSFDYYFIIFTLLPILRVCRRVLAKPRKFLKDHEKYCIART